MKLVLLHGSAWEPDAAFESLSAALSPLERKVISSVGTGTVDERPTVLLLDDRTADVGEKTAHSLVHGVIQLEGLTRCRRPADSSWLY